MNEEIIQNLNERLDDAIERGRTMLEEGDLERNVHEMKSRAEETIRRHPIKTVAIGFAVGFLAAKIFNSND